MRRLNLWTAVLVLWGCATTSPRFDQDVATSFVQDDMRKLETPDIELYYPAQYQVAARRVAARASECLRALRSRAVTKRHHARALLFITSANFNNAYVSGQYLGEPLLALNPLSFTDELSHWYGLGGAEAGDTACHEMFHYAHFEQVHGFWDVANTVLGNVMPPQAFLERWFTEGVAQFYESRLDRSVGRSFSPLYRGSFDSFVAMRRGRLGGGDLSLYQRELSPFGGAYLTGLHFVEWLASKYGEDKLWELMDLQGRSLFSVLGVTLRFKQVYGLSTGALLDEWSQELTATLKVRTRPTQERSILDDAGQLARLASHPPTGALAIVSNGNEQVPTLRILEGDGSVRVERRLAMLGPNRQAIQVGPISMSGLSFTSDGQFLFLLNDDLIERGDTRAQVWKLDAQSGEVLHIYQNVGRGLGGAVSGDGFAYTYVEFPPGGGARILERKLDSGLERLICEFPLGVSVSAPQWNPAHTQLVYSRLDANGWNLVLRTEEGTSRDLTTDGAFNYGAKWIDETHLLFARSDGRYLQAHKLDLQSGALERVSDTPYGLLDPSPIPSGLAAVVRDGVHWSIDSMPAVALESVASPAEQRPLPPQHQPEDLEILSDEQYSPLDHLLLPQLRAPGGTVESLFARDGSFQLRGSVSLSLMGRDRLGKHSWALEGALHLPTLEHSARVGYRNLTLAPWAIGIEAQRDGFSSEAYWAAGVFAERSIYTVPLSFGVQSEIWQPLGQPLAKYVGPAFAMSYSAGDETGYAGPQRAYTFSLQVSGYSQLLASDSNMLDLRSSLSIALPLPLSKRHSLRLAATGRFLPGAPPGALRVGGSPSLTNLYSSRRGDGMPAGPSINLPGILVEKLRGFDDFALRAQHVGLFNARYRYSFIIDRGFASVAYLLPSLFIRQVDMEAFGAAAITESQVARSAGASLAIRAAFGGVLPLSLTYQFAWRFDFGLPPLHVVGISFD